MALLANGSRALTGPCARLGAASFLCHGRQFFNDIGSELAHSYSESGATPRAAVPNGYLHPGAWVQPIKGGNLASINEIGGSGVVASANLAGGRNGGASLAGSGALTGSLAALASAVATLAGTSTLAAGIQGSLNAVATLSGTGTISNAALSLIAQAVATLTGTGGLTASISAALSGAATLAGFGSLTAGVTGVIQAVATLSGSGALSAADLRAVGNLTASITVAGAVDPLSPASLAAAVWNALAADFVAAGTMGEIMGAGGSLTPDQATQLLELWRLAGLDIARPLAVTATDRDAGAEIHQDITEASGTVTVTRS